MVKLAFEAEGSYKDPVETVQVTLIRKEKSPLSVTLDGAVIPHFLKKEEFEKAEAGWYYSQTKRAAEIKYKNPLKAKDKAELIVSFKEFDLIGM
jgi:alpha-glucosidase